MKTVVGLRIVLCTLTVTVLLLLLQGTAAIDITGSGQPGNDNTGSGQSGALQFLEFGENRRFVINRVSSDAASEPISIPFGFPFGSVIHTLAYVGTNGIISFSRPFLLWNPESFPGGVFSSVRDFHVVAPYWSDNDIRREGTVSYEVFQLQATGEYGDRLLDEVSSYIRACTNTSSNFKGSFMILAEWRGVHPYPHGAAGAPENDPFLTQTNTYQAVVITNLVESYVIFIYECGSIEWAGEFTFPTIGFNSPSTADFFNHPFTGQSFANEIACRESNLLYQISVSQSFVEEQKQMCLEWYSSDIDRFRTASLSISALDSLTESCPCSLFQAFFDFRYFLFSITENTWCFLLRFRSFQFGTDRECCYSSDFGALIVGPTNGGSLLIVDGTFESYEQDNFLPKSNCCSDLVGLCDLYFERRPSDTCARYRPLRRTWMWGDPHFTTLDDFTYTFNGVGEYVLLRSMGEFNVEFQGRTAVVPDSNATVFSAFGIQHEDDTVQLSVMDGDFVALLNGSDISSQLATTGANISNTTYYFERSANNSMMVQFPSGLGLTANYSNGILSFVLNLPPTFNITSQGLLGTLNGNISDDLIFRNGTVLPTNSTDREKHSFGQSWQITADESIFTYASGQNVDTFSDPNHEPPFLDEIRANLEGNNTLFQVCGDNLQCLFDVGQTGDENVGMDTLQFEEQVEEQVIMSDTFPPNVTAPEVFMATVNTSSVYLFMVTGSTSVNVSVNGQFVLPSNIDLTNTSDVDYMLTWNPQDVEEEVNITIVASVGNVSSVSNPRVRLCGCMNNGNCTEAGVLNLEQPFTVLNCECPPAYDGNFCEGDANGCAETSCFEGQMCVDNTAPLSGAECTCPIGYMAVDSKCADINECNTQNHSCTELQMCENTAGSFTCPCMAGYRPSSPLLCEDINECAEFSDNCHQLCNNNNGSFSCSCRPGFELNPDNVTCNVTNECPTNHSCSQLCSVDPDSGMELCSCERGYVLDSDNTTCSDVDECDIDGSCSQNCSNTIGSFTCSCNSGYTLNIDNRNCDDINECSSFPCMTGLMCLNTLGSFECQCPSGTVMMNNMCRIVITMPPSPSTSSISMTSSTVTSSTMTSSTMTSSTMTTSTATPTPTRTVGNQDDDDDDGLSGGAIAGIVIGCTVGLVLIVIVVIVVVVCLDRHRTKTVTITPSLVYKNVRTSPEVTGNVYTEMSQTTTHSQENGGGEEEFSHL